MRGVVALAWASLRAEPRRSLAIVFALFVTILLPVLSWHLRTGVQAAITARAEASPIVVGARGESMELVLSALYFRGRAPDGMTAGDVERLDAEVEGVVVPLSVRHTAGGAPVVGTTLALFDQRRLSVAAGRGLVVLGDAVIGADLARRGLEVGDGLPSDPQGVYDLGSAGSVRLSVVGVLAPTGGPEDGAVFVDLKTSWLLDGHLHGHAGDEGDAGDLLLTEVTDANLGSFHLHGGPADWPVTAALVFPRDDAEHDLLLGHLLDDPRLQAARPIEVVRQLRPVFDAAREVSSVFARAIVSVTTVLLGVIAWMQRRLRAGEMALMRRLGASNVRVEAVFVTELLLLVGAALGMAVPAGWVLGRLLMPGW